MQNKNLEWYVYRESWQTRKIEKHNVFNHVGFSKEVDNLLKTCQTVEEFDKKLNSELMYYYWSKCEWEILVSPWIGDVESRSTKIDVYDQVMLNWDKFRDYVWSFK